MPISISEVVFAAVLALILLGMSIYFGVRQLRELKRIPTLNLPEEELRHERRQAWRRLFCCGLTLLLALLLPALVAYWEPVNEQLRDRIDPAAEITPDQRLVVRVYLGGWLVFLLLLLLLLLLAGIDLWVNRLHGLRQYRKLSADRRAMIERQANRLRGQRNGQH